MTDAFIEPSCRVCGCTDSDCRQCIEKTGVPCHWVEQDLCSACAADGATTRPALDLGTCCVCEQTANVRNIVMLNFKSPQPGAGCWGCTVCGLPEEGAFAVCCDACSVQVLRTNGACIRYAVLGGPALNQRIPVTDLTERFEHDAGVHECLYPTRGRNARWN